MGRMPRVAEIVSRSDVLSLAEESGQTDNVH